MAFSPRGVVMTIAGTGRDIIPDREVDSIRVGHVTRSMRDTTAGVGHSLDIRRVRSVMRSRVVGRHTFSITHHCVACHCAHTLIEGTGAASRRVLDLVRYGGRRIGRRGDGGGPAIGDIRHSCVTNRIDGSVAHHVLLDPSVISTRSHNLVRFRSTSCFTRRVRGYSLMGLRSVLRGNAMVDNASVRHPRDFSATYGVTARVVTRITSYRCNKRDVDLARLTPFISMDHGGVRDRILTRVRSTNVGVSRSGTYRVARGHLLGRVTHNIRAVRCRIMALVAAGNRTPFIAMFVCLGRTGSRRRGTSLTLVVRRILGRHCRNIGGRGNI